MRSALGERVELTLGLGQDVGAGEVDAAHLERVLANLVLNARDAIPYGGTLEVITDSLAATTGDEAISLAPGDYVRPAGQGQRRRDGSGGGGASLRSFYTTKPPGSGTGLGLPTIHGLVAQAGGAVTLDSREGEGTTVTILLPVTDAKAERAGDPVPPLRGAHPDRPGAAILVVDNESALRSVTRRLLEREGHRVEEAATAAEALAVCADPDKPLDVLLTDVVMPGMPGTEFAEEATRLRPELEVIFMSGYGDDVKPLCGLHGTASFLQKPFTPEGLMRCLRQQPARVGGTDGRVPTMTSSGAPHVGARSADRTPMGSPWPLRPSQARRDGRRRS